jgi:hypothetical protein
VGGYTNHRCRCEACTEANNAKQRKYLATNGEQRDKHRERRRRRYQQLKR